MQLSATPDFAEGLRAFLEKRSPEFRVERRVLEETRLWADTRPAFSTIHPSPGELSDGRYPAGRLPGALDGILRGGNVLLYEPEPAGRELLLKVHTPELLEGVEREPLCSAAWHWAGGAVSRRREDRGGRDHKRFRLHRRRRASRGAERLRGLLLLQRRGYLDREPAGGTASSVSRSWTRTRTTQTAPATSCGAIPTFSTSASAAGFESRTARKWTWLIRPWEEGGRERS